MTDAPPRKLLIVEDDEGLQRQLRWAYDDYEVIVAGDRATAIDMVRRGAEAGIEVADKGPGMTADFVRGSLFRPFTSTKAGGFGVGAYEARALVSAMGGRIGIVTAPGEGTRMTIWLPGAEPVPTRVAA
jgi:signal transduction histidine kinase